MAYITVAPNHVITGSNLWITVHGAPDGVPPGYEAYCHYFMDFGLHDAAGDVVEGAEVSFSYQNGMHGGYEGEDGKYWVPYTPFEFNVELPDMAAGEYSLNFVMCCIGNTQSLADGIYETISVRVVVTHEPPVREANTGYPIPGLAAYEDHMVELADHWMPSLLDPNNTWGTNNYYYDVPSTYLAVSSYWHTAIRYWDVAVESGLRYCHYLMEECQPPGAASGYTVFPRGLRQLFSGTRDQHWLDALLSLRRSAWAPSGGAPDPALMRETAYALEVWLELEWVNEGDRELAERSVTYLLGMFNLLCVQQFGKTTGMPCQPFIFGLAMQALVDYYDYRKDPRIPQALMGTCTWLWQNAVDPNTGFVKYDVWNQEARSVDAHSTGTAYTSLNPLMYNAWGFLYAVTGDHGWRQQGDILFEHQFDDGEWSWSPKQFAQIYRRSMDYVTRWRR